MSIDQVRGQWSMEEDSLLAEVVQRHGAKNWTMISRSIPGRTPSSCRLRWCNQLSPDLNHGPFTPEEDRIIHQTHAIMGNKWADIARLLVGRTDNLVKNRWHSFLKKELDLQIIINQDHEEEELGQEDQEDTTGALVVLSEAAYMSNGLQLESDMEEEPRTEPAVEEKEEEDMSDIDPKIVGLINKTVNEVLPGIVRKEMETLLPTILREEMLKHIPILLSKEMEKYTVTFNKKE